MPELLGSKSANPTFTSASFNWIDSTSPGNYVGHRPETWKHIRKALVKYDEGTLFTELKQVGGMDIPVEKRAAFSQYVKESENI